MKQFTDRTGLTVTASSADSADKFADLTSAYLGFRPDTGLVLKDLLTGDPDMPMAQCANGYFAKLIGGVVHSPRAAGISAKLNTQLDSLEVSGRERRHAAALTAWSAGQLDAAAGIWEDILLNHPHDSMALRLAHFTHFYTGDGRRMRDSTARILPLWPDDHPHYGYVLGMHAFGLEESADYARAEDFGRRAVERNPEDAWSVHAVAHVLEMTERHQEGIEWVRSLEPSWSKVNNFRFHLYWHQCLYHLERGEFGEVMRLYDEQVASDVEADFYLDICNATSLLWRLEMFGVDVGERWHRLAQVSRKHLQDTDLIFVSLHHLMAVIADGDEAAAKQMIDNIRTWSSLETSQSKICTDVGIALAEGLQLARSGEHAAAFDKINKVRYALDCIGGSKAQRDVFHMILLDAAKAGADALKARALFAERLGQKVHSGWSW
ncbi:MAG: tetratricopeptide repeat protein, partial [Aestuariivirgaceae bacterium]